MIKRYVGIAALVVGMTASACATEKVMPTQKPISQPEPIQLQQPLLTDFFFSSPVLVDGTFANFIGPGIWEVVQPHGNTHIGTVEYLVEALDTEGRVIAFYEGAFNRQQLDRAKDKPTLSELVTLLIADERQMKNPVPKVFEGNPRYMIPSFAAAVRVTVDPANKIEEIHENNNAVFWILHPTYSTV